MISERENLIINSKFTHENIFDLYKNFDTMSFLDLSVNYNILRDKGYSKDHLNQQLNSFLSLPFFLFIMTSLAAILSMGTLKNLIIFTIFLLNSSHNIGLLL